MNELLQLDFSLEDPIGKAIVNLIQIFFWVGVANYGWHFLRLIYEGVCLFYVRKHIKNHGFSDVSTDFLNRFSQSLIFQKVIGFSSISRRIRELVNIKQNGGEIDHDVLGDIHAGASSRKAGLSRYILGILIILGLVGTLSGLTTAVKNAEFTQTEIQNLDQLKPILGGMQTALSGMNTAFVTTLAGLLASLCLGFIGWLFNLSNSVFLTRFEKTVSTEIIPHFTQTPEIAIVSSMDGLKSTVDEFKMATETNVQKMQQSIQQLTEKSWDTYLEQQYVITQELSEIPAELRESLGGINEYQVLIKSTMEKSDKTTKQFMKTTKQFMNKISEFQATIETIINDFKGLTDQSVSQVAEYQSDVKSIVNDFGNFTERSMSQVSEYQSEMLVGLENVVSEFRQESAGLKTTIDKAQESQSIFVHEFADNLSDTLANTLKTQLQSMFQPIVESQQVMVASLHESTDNLREDVKSIVNDFELFTERSISQVSEYQSEMLAGLENVVSEFRQESAGLKATVQEAQESQARFVDELTVNLSDTLANTLQTQLQSMLQPIVENQQVMVDGLRDIVKDLRAVAGELQIRSVLENQEQFFERIRSDLAQNQQLIANRLSQLIGELQVQSTLEEQNKVFERIEGHLEGQRELVNEQNEIMQTLDSSVKQLQQTFSKTESDEQQRTEQMIRELQNNFTALGEKMDTLNNTMNKPGLYRWGTEVRRWFGLNRKKGNINGS